MSPIPDASPDRDPLPEELYAAPSTAVQAHPPQAAIGIGGWLILLGIGVVLSPFAIAFHLVDGFYPLFTDGTWELLTTPGEANYDPAWKPLLLFEFLSNLIFLFCYSLACVRFLQKSEKFPRLYIAILMVRIAFLAADSYLASRVAEPIVAEQGGPREVVRVAIVAGIWVPYLMLSKRSKATFVR